MNKSATVCVHHAVTALRGSYPGHLGELTQYLPFELVDAVLAQTRTVQRRLGMFPGLGYARVWATLTAGLAGLDVPRPSEKGAAGPAPPARGRAAMLHLASLAADQVVAFRAVDVLDIPPQAVKLSGRIHSQGFDRYFHFLRPAAYRRNARGLRDRQAFERVRLQARQRARGS